MDGITDHQRSLFRDATVLTDGYSPDEPIGREALVERVHEAVRPVAHRKPPTNLALFGPPGSGKTTVVRHVLDQLERDTRVATATINCWQYRTRPAFLTELLIQLGYPEPRKGRPVDERLGTFQERLAKSDGIVVALDEVDQLTHQREIVYDLHETGARADAALGLILVSTQPLTALELEARSRSRFDYRSLPVQPYSADDLADILHQRVENAFEQDVVAPDAVERIATTVADHDGDCRRAFALLRRAGRLAEREDASEVTGAHVEEVVPGKTVQ